MTGHLYTSILSKSLLGSLQDQKTSTHHIIFQQDNDPKHTSKVAQAWLKDNNIRPLPWPASSPDINIIENLWEHLDTKVRSRKVQPHNLDELWQALQEEWASIDIKYI
jgi:hypothetical protein